jgi:hypothetical protein
MEERHMEEEGKNRKRKGWGLEKKMQIFGIIIFMFVIRNPKARRANKASDDSKLTFLQVRKNKIAIVENF